MSDLHCPTCGRKLTIFQGEGTCLDCNKTFPTSHVQTTAAQSSAATPSHVVTFLAVGIIAAFFMPWFQLFGAGVSGFQITKLGSYTNYLWVIPGLAGLTVLLGASGGDNRIMGAITGVVPLGALAYGYFYIQQQSQGVQHRRGDINIDLSSIATNTMAIGFFLTVGLCILIIFCGAQNKKAK